MVHSHLWGNAFMPAFDWGRWFWRRNLTLDSKTQLVKKHAASGEYLRRRSACHCANPLSLLRN